MTIASGEFDTSKGEYLTFTEQFESMDELRSIVANRELCPLASEWSISCNDMFGQNVELRKDWTGYATSWDALEQMTTGRMTPSVKDKLKATRQDIILEQRDLARKRTVTFAPCGGMVAVPRYLAGNDMCMVTAIPQRRNQRVIEIGIDTSISARVSKKDVAHMATLIICVIMKLDAMGFKTSLKAIDTAVSQQAIYGISLTLKRFSEQFDANRIWNVLGGTGMTRVVSFGWLTRLEQWTGESGYGRPIDVTLYGDDRAEYFKRHFNLSHVFTMNELIGCYGHCDDEFTIKELIQLLTR